MILVLSTLPSVAIISISVALHCVDSKQSLYVTTHHGSHLFPHQLSISMILATSGSHDSLGSSTKSILQASWSHGVGASDGDELGKESVGDSEGSALGDCVGGKVGCGVGSGVGFGVGTGVGAGVGLGVGASVGGTLGSSVWVSSIGGIVG